MQRVVALIFSLLFLFPYFHTQSTLGQAPPYASYQWLSYNSPKLFFSSNDSKFFEIIYFPKYLRIYDYPIFQNQRFFELPLRQDYYDICHTPLITVSLNESTLSNSCFEFFSQNYSQLETYSYPVQEQITNQCLFCIDAKFFRNQMDSLYQNLSFNSSSSAAHLDYGYILEKLYLYYSATRDRCFEGTSTALLTQIYLSQQRQLQQKNVDSNPYMCYCYANNQYAYDCSAYAIFFIPTRTIGLSFIYLITVMTMLLGATIFIVIPRCSACCCGKFTFKNRCKQVFQLRNFIAMYLFFSLISFIVEWVNWLPVQSEFLSLFIFYGRGIFRLLSAIFTVAAFLLLMMLWANILRLTDVMQKKGIHYAQKNEEMSSLSLCEMAVIALLHFLFVLQFTVSATLYALFQQYYGIVYGVTTLLCLIYLTIITIGYLCYGVALYIRLSRLASKSKRALWASYKFTRFMVLAEFGFVVMYVVLILQVLAYLLGWDILGPLLGQYIINIIDFCLFYLQFCIMYSLLNGNLIVQTYCCLYCRRKKRMSKEEQHTTAATTAVAGSTAPSAATTAVAAKVTVASKNEQVVSIPPLKKQLDVLSFNMEDISSFELDLTPTNSEISMREEMNQVQQQVDVSPLEQLPSASTEVLSSHDQ